MNFVEKEIAGKVEKLAVYEKGTSAFYDTFSGMVPCRVTEVLDEGCNGRLVSSGFVEIQITKDHGPYKKGETMRVQASKVVPRKHRILSGYQYRINTMYIYTRG